MRTPGLAALLILSSSLVACSTTPTEGDDPDDGIAVDDGKEDNFLSQDALEFVLEGKSSVKLDPAMATSTDAVRMAAAKKLIGYKQIAIAWFVTQYFVDKEDDDANFHFGGFGGMAKGGMWEDLGVTEEADHVTYDFTFKQLAAGPKNLMSKLEVKTVAGKQVFDLAIGLPTNDEMTHLVTDEEWYRQAPWDAWDPTKVDASKQTTMTFSIAPDSHVSTDAFFDVKKLISDGVLDLDVHFGWDYHDNFHLKHSKDLFGWLVDQGFTAPVASWEKLTHTSGPFTRTVDANGTQVKIEVRIFFGKPGAVNDTETDAGGKVLEADLRNSMKVRDVVIFDGHAGPFYGFSMANWNKTNEGDFDDADMRTADLATKYQVVLAEGCETYQIGEALQENPNKNGKNVDVITSMSFSNAATAIITEDFITQLTAHDSSNRLRPTNILGLLTKLDRAASDATFHTMYGIHGIDEDPHLHPFANTAMFGKKCRANADCGGPGNLCVTMGAAGKKCTAACAGASSAASGCPTSYTCKAVASASSSTIFGRVCAK
ncbi:MAG: hypothetical protein ABI591_08560 [Kofleriaceae bacterium]